MKIIDWFKKWYNTLIFKYEIQRVTTLLKSLPDESFIKYPLLVTLTFNEDWYRNRYDNGISVRTSLLEKSKEIRDELLESLNQHMS